MTALAAALQCPGVRKPDLAELRSHRRSSVWSDIAPALLAMAWTAAGCGMAFAVWRMWA